MNGFLERVLSTIRRVQNEVHLLSDDLDKFMTMWEFNTQDKKEDDYSSISKKEINIIKNQIRLIDQPCTLLVTKLSTKLDEMIHGIRAKVQAESDAELAAALKKEENKEEPDKASQSKKKSKKKKKDKNKLEDIDGILELLVPEHKPSFNDRLHNSMGTMK